MFQNSAHPGYQGKKVAVFGASGFIGRWVARTLNRFDATTYLFVRDPLIAKRVFHAYQVNGEIIEVDALDFDKLRRLYQEIKPDITFNLVGYGVDRSERDETQAEKINAEFVRALCEIIAETCEPGWVGVNLVHVGSALEYGEIAGNLHEDSHPSPTTLYGRTKLAGTDFLKENSLQLGIRGLTARLFTVYGHGEHPGRLLPSLFDAAMTGKSLALTDGLQKRDFTYVEDVAEGLLRLGLCTVAPGSIVNLATGRLSSVHRFIEIASEILSIQANQLNFGALPTRTYEMKHLPVSIVRLVKLVSWRPPTTLEDGIRKTWLFEKDIQSQK
jgi:nucleoside-diphosphate-sugar epimerase